MKKIIYAIFLLFSFIFLFACGTEQTTPKQYTITLLHNENTTTLLIEENTAFYYDEIYEDGYVFFGWYDENDNEAIGQVISADRTFIGKYIEEGMKYKINYILNGGELKSYSPKVYEVGKVTELVKPTAIGTMKFLGWYLNGELVEEIDGYLYGHITLEAKWEDLNVYHSVEYILNGGEITGDYVTTFIEGLADYSLPTPKKEGYLFEGWYTEETFNNRIITITRDVKSDLKLFAKYKEYSQTNLNISFLGDSITTFAGSIPSEYPAYYPAQGCDVNSVEKTWWHQVVSSLNYQLLMNNSYSGSKVVSGDGCGQSYERIVNLSKNNISPDVIVIHMGTNDLTHRLVTSSFEKAYETMIDIIREQCDDAIIYVLTLPSMKHQGFLDLRLEYNEIIKNIARKKDLIVVDIANLITEENYVNYMYAGAHPNAAGMTIISEAVIKKIKETI